MSDDILQALRTDARENPERLALISPRGNLTVHQLESRSSACARGLALLGLRSRDRVALLVTPGPEFLITAVGLLKLGCVMVLVDPGIGIDSLGSCLEESEPSAFIGVPLAQFARRWLGWAETSVRVSISTGRRWGLADYSLREILEAGRVESDREFPEHAPDHPVAVAFTSGSTGPPKGVIHTHRMFQAQVRMLREAYRIQPREVDLATFPLFGLFDLGWKATTLFPEMDFSRPGQVDAEKIVHTIQEQRATHMFGSPALLDRVSRWAAPRDVKLPSLRRVLSAGAPVSPEILERFKSLLRPGVDVHTPYGATEALPVSTVAAHEILSEKGWGQGRGVCVGKAFPGVELEIISISDEALSTWTPGLLVESGRIGEITVSGPNVSPGYYRRPEADRVAKIPDGKSLWHRMGDVGYRDEQRRLWFCGRKAHRVETGETTLFSVQVEGVYNQHPDVFRSALVGIGKRGRQRPVLCVELEAGSAREKGPELVAEILALGSEHPFGRYLDTLLFHDGFPVDIRHNAKIFREELAIWAETRLTVTAGAEDA